MTDEKNNKPKISRKSMQHRFDYLLHSVLDEIATEIEENGFSAEFSDLELHGQEELQDFISPY